MDVMMDQVVGAVVPALTNAILVKEIAMLILTALAIWNVALTIVTWAWDLHLDMIVASEVRTVKIVSFLDIVCCSAQKITDIWKKKYIFIILLRLLSCKWGLELLYKHKSMWHWRGRLWYRFTLLWESEMWNWQLWHNSRVSICIWLLLWPCHHTR